MEKDKKLSLKILNPNDAVFVYYLDVVHCWEVGLGMPPEFENLPDISFVKIDREVSVDANEIKKVKVTFNFPNDEKYKGKNYSFAVKATVAGAPIEFNQLARFFITTAK